MTDFKLKFEYFKSHFRIAQKNFRSKWHRLEAEAFFIRMTLPKLNDQKEQEFFKLFWSVKNKVLASLFFQVMHCLSPKLFFERSFV